MNQKDMSNEVEDLVSKFTKGTKYALKQEELRLQQELAAAKQDIDMINKEVELNMQAK